jgi:hypothetical protein
MRAFDAIALVLLLQSAPVIGQQVEPAERSSISELNLCSPPPPRRPGGGTLLPNWQYDLAEAAITTLCPEPICIGLDCPTPVRNPLGGNLIVGDPLLVPTFLDGTGYKLQHFQYNLIPERE